METSTPIRRATKQREAVSTYIEEQAGFLSAQQVHAGLRHQGNGIGLATVYRTLQSLADDEVVDTLRTNDGEQVYRWCRTSGHHHHLVCRVCGRTEEVAGPAVERWASRIADEHGFRDVSHTIELFGTCPAH
ncbi:MAG: Fur family transcriptional regulator [Actinomycetota bacterium]